MDGAEMYNALLESGRQLDMERREQRPSALELLAQAVLDNRVSIKARPGLHGKMTYDIKVED